MTSSYFSNSFSYSSFNLTHIHTNTHRLSCILPFIHILPLVQLKKKKMWNRTKLISSKRRNTHKKDEYNTMHAHTYKPSKRTKTCQYCISWMYCIYSKKNTNKSRWILISKHPSTRFYNFSPSIESSENEWNAVEWTRTRRRLK